MLLAWTNVEIQKDRVHLLFLLVVCDVSWQLSGRYESNHLTVLLTGGECLLVTEESSILSLISLIYCEQADFVK